MKLTKSTFFLGCLVGGMGAALTPLLLTFSQAQPQLLPFQGRLTDAAGTNIADGAKVVEFKMYDAPTGGNVKWAGEVHKLSVNGGLVNTMLGSKASLGSVDFSTPTYLQITVDANDSKDITAADPPLLPRQSVVPAVFAMEAANARDSLKLAGTDWSSIMVDGAGQPSNVPGTGFVKGSKVEAGGITGTQLAANAVDAGKIADGSVGTSKLSANAVTSDRIANGSIQSEDLSVGLQTSLVLPGTVVPYAGSSVTANSGWLLCDGRAVSRTQYAALFAAIGTTHGVGDAATTFNLPDYRGRFLRGVDDPDGAGGLAAAARDPDVAARTAMATGGNETGRVGSVQGDEFKSHNHRQNFSGGVGSKVGYGHALGQAYDKEGGAGVGFPVMSWESGGSETRPKNAYVNYLIKY